MSRAEGPAGKVTVIGLGPGDVDLVTGAARDALARIPTSEQHVRTRRHPAARLLEAASSFDEVYEREPTMDAVYRRIVETLVERATDAGEVLYAVPGSPVVAERTVELLVEDDRVETELVPALSFLDLAWVRLRVDPVAVGVRIVDGQSFELDAAGQTGPFLVAQCDTVATLSDIKLAVGDVVDGVPGATMPEVAVLHHLGLPDERVWWLAADDLDREVRPDHLTSVYVPQLAAPVAGEVQRFVELVGTLRRECPWDREQTHASLKRHLLEESYEVLDALDDVDPAAGTGYEHLEEELGDLLFQIVFHATLATEAGQFTLADVSRTVHDKLRDRHPHVFGEDADADLSAADVASTWEQRKKLEKGRDSVFDGIPEALPALLYALKVQKKASTLGDLPQGLGPRDALDMVLAETSAETVGELLYALVDLARQEAIDPEDALRRAAHRHRDDAQQFER